MSEIGQMDHIGNGGDCGNKEEHALSKQLSGFPV